MPPASPPLVSTAMLEGAGAEGAVAVSVIKEARGQDLSGHQSYCDDVRYVPYVSKGRPDGGGHPARIQQSGRTDKASAGKLTAASVRGS
jgi:hypothetical protein